MTNSGLGDIQKGGNWREVTTSGFAADTYPASVVDRAIVFCFLHDQLMRA